MLVCAAGGESARVVREILLTSLPSAAVSVVDAPSLAEGELPRADAAVVDVGRAVRAGVDAFRALRARGFTGRVVLVAESEDDEALTRAVNALGAAEWMRGSELAAQPLRLAQALVADSEEREGSVSAALAELARTRRALAAGELTLRLQHDINNPLAGLLAEVQLLQLDELTPDQRAATDRILELCRRIVGLVRRLDALADAGAGRAARV